jgi:hypothetical protein
VALFDRYALVSVDGNVVTIWTARSQSRAAMSDEQFRDSSTRVLDMIAKRLGISRPIAEQNAGRNA